jgi:hypothetical protein
MDIRVNDDTIPRKIRNRRQTWLLPGKGGNIKKLAVRLS